MLETSATMILPLIQKCFKLKGMTTISESMSKLFKKKSKVVSQIPISVFKSISAHHKLLVNLGPFIHWVNHAIRSWGYGNDDEDKVELAQN